MNYLNKEIYLFIYGIQISLYYNFAYDIQKVNVSL